MRTDTPHFGVRTITPPDATRNYRNNTLIFTFHKSQTSVFQNFSTDYGNIPRLSLLN